MAVPIWLRVDLHRSRNWPWLHNVSTSGSLAKGEDYPAQAGRDRHQEDGDVSYKI
jgi:hypothetical protein